MTASWSLLVVGVFSWWHDCIRSSLAVIVAGEAVEKLSLVDSPCPLVIPPPMPPRLDEFFDSIDRFCGNKYGTKEPEEAVEPIGSLFVMQTLSVSSHMFQGRFPILFSRLGRLIILLNMVWPAKER